MAPTFSYSDLLPLGEDTTQYRLISKEGVSVVKLGDKEFLQVTPEALTLLTETAMRALSLGTLGNSSKSPVRVLPAHLTIVSISRFVEPDTSSNSSWPAVSLNSLIR